MKKIWLSALLLAVSGAASAVSPGGPNCGWGNLLFEGESGIAPHFLASTTNGTSGNKTFGMTSGTNGCSVEGTLTYGGENLLAQAGVLEEVAHDMAVGHGQALTALAVAMGVDPEDRAYFNAVMHRHFNAIFTHPEVTAKQVTTNIHEVMRSNKALSVYVS